MSDIDADRARLLDLIRAKAIVHGRVVLSSGKEADYYVDLRRITLDGEASPLVGRVMLDLVADLDIDAVGGLTLGADPVATAMLHARAASGGRLDAFVVRKAGKAHGLQQRIEGPA
ncbi:MAG TPA: orotate phosphoribosyltransferase, partial [Phycicoccus sp.]